MTRYDVGCNYFGELANSGTITSGCIIGVGSAGDPVRLNLDPNGSLTCGVSGLAVSGVVGSGGVLFEVAVSGITNPSGWTAVSGSQSLIYDNANNDFYGFIGQDGTTKHPIHRASCYTIPADASGSFADQEDPTGAEASAYLAGLSITAKWGDIVKYVSPEGQHVFWDVCASGGLQDDTSLEKRTHPCGLNDLGSVVSVDFTKGFDAKNIDIPAASGTALDFTATDKCWYTLQITNAGAGSVTWPSGVLWSGAPPQPAVGAGVISVFEFWYDGTNFHGRQ